MSAAIDFVTNFADCDLTVDLSRVKFLDAATICVLVGATVRQRARGRGLHLQNPSPVAHRLITLCELGELVTHTPARRPAPDLSHANSASVTPR